MKRGAPAQMVEILPGLRILRTYVRGRFRRCAVCSLADTHPEVFAQVNLMLVNGETQQRCADYVARETGTLSRQAGMSSHYAHLMRILSKQTGLIDRVEHVMLDSQASLVLMALHRALLKALAQREKKVDKFLATLTDEQLIAIGQRTLELQLKMRVPTRTERKGGDPCDSPNDDFGQLAGRALADVGEAQRFIEQQRSRKGPRSKGAAAAGRGTVPVAQ